jgi:hypothetical protein
MKLAHSHVQARALQSEETLSFHQMYISLSNRQIKQEVLDIL